ncbi:hypothetical protein HYV89_03345 [Candidatus Woesearchaeota archaeon]|nr:hypothetical protein [Candidatus Woesearchaeota archaeon]
MIVKCRELAKNIYLVKFQSKKQLAKTFLRFQEHFESPKFRKKVFKLSEFKEWYVKNSPAGIRTGKFTYYKDWGGFNIPSKVLEPFYRGKFNPLTREEKILLGLFKSFRRKNFYIIAIHDKSGKHTLQHEIAHGLFYTNPRYKKAVIGILKKCDKNSREEINKFLLNRGGYHPDVWMDETHTHIMTDMSYLKRHGVNTKKLSGINKELNNVFKRYFKR